MDTQTAALPPACAAADAGLRGGGGVRLAAAGWAGPPPAAGSPVPAPAIPRLTVIASRVAEASGDSAPQWVTALITQHGVQR